MCVAERLARFKHQGYTKVFDSCWSMSWTKNVKTVRGKKYLETAGLSHKIWANEEWRKIDSIWKVKSLKEGSVLLWLIDKVNAIYKYKQHAIIWSPIILFCKFIVVLLTWCFPICLRPFSSRGRRWRELGQGLPNWSVCWENKNKNVAKNRLLILCILKCHILEV